ncbi:MAG: hypothetical protein A2Y38_00245 [Spirochaetes bacterium GWB1_59_5]|nr:MAG: hypothetical protein A2Y38_00245 [Spirochaetes bacterium GWB1_59_5]
MYNKHLLILTGFLSLACIVNAQDLVTEGLSLETRGELQYNIERSSSVTNLVGIDFGFDSTAFSLSAAIYLANDGKYYPLKSNFGDKTLLNYYAVLESGGLVWRPDQNLSFRIGRLEHRDQLDGPYSLFASSSSPAVPLIEIRYENDYFFYESRWVELNSRSEMVTEAYPEGFPDRGANLKAYGFKIGDMRFGIQDSAVYVGRSFDFEYLLSPIPQYFTQYVKGTVGRPWTDGSNDNDIIGVFWDWNRPDGLSFDAQFLMDDLNIHFLGIGTWNPGKAAWAMRARAKTRAGTFSLSHAGALKYTFQPTRDNEDGAYSYTYYPDTRFTIGTSYREISFDDLMLGYKNGENNVALRLDYEGVWSGIDITSNLEFVLSGSKSPTNAWNDDTWHDYKGSRMLDDDVLEKLVTFNLKASRRFGDFVVEGAFLLGGAFNALELVQPEPVADAADKLINKYSYIWKPGDDNEFLFGASIGLRYDIPVMGLFR